MEKLYTSAIVKSIDQQAGTFEVVASSGKVDRLGDTIDPKGWYLKNYKENPVILWAHSAGGFMAPALPPVAKALKVWVEDEKELKLQGQFATTPFAQELRTLVEGGFLNAVSVGFLPLVEDTKGEIEIESKMYRRALDEEITKGIYGEGGQKFNKQELLEVSWVCVPALPNALVAARKMNLALVTKELEAIQKEKPKKEPEEECEKCKILEERNKELEDLLEIKPYPTEHSCRLEDPGKYKRFRRENCAMKHDGKCIDVVWGITKGEEEKVERQAMRYDKKVWTEASARAHCKDNDGSFEPASEEESFNKELILNQVSKMEEAINALKELLSPEKGIVPSADKGRLIKPSKRSPEMEAELKVLSMADKALEILRHKLIKKLKEQ